MLQRTLCLENWKVEENPTGQGKPLDILDYYIINHAQPVSSHLKDEIPN